MDIPIILSPAINNSISQLSLEEIEKEYGEHLVIVHRGFKSIKGIIVPTIPILSIGIMKKFTNVVPVEILKELVFIENGDIDGKEILIVVPPLDEDQLLALIRPIIIDPFKELLDRISASSILLGETGDILEMASAIFRSISSSEPKYYKTNNLGKRSWKSFYDENTFEIINRKQSEIFLKDYIDKYLSKMYTPLPRYIHSFETIKELYKLILTYQSIFCPLKGEYEPMSEKASQSKLSFVFSSHMGYSNTFIHLLRKWKDIGISGKSINDDALRRLAWEEIRVITTAKENEKIDIDSPFIFSGDEGYWLRKDNISTNEEGITLLGYFAGKYLDELDLTYCYITGSAIPACYLRSNTIYDDSMIQSISYDKIDMLYPMEYTINRGGDEVKAINGYNIKNCKIIRNGTELTLEFNNGDIANFDIVEGSDLDIAVDDSLSIEEFDNICEKNFKIMSKYYPQIRLEKTERPNYHIWEVRGEGFRKVQMYQSSIKGILSHHVDPVRGFVTGNGDNRKVYLSATAIQSAYKKRIFHIYPSIMNSNNPIEVLRKYFYRGYHYSSFIVKVIKEAALSRGLNPWGRNYDIRQIKRLSKFYMDNYPKDTINLSVSRLF